jgi:hypothetical protein
MNNLYKHLIKENSESNERLTCSSSGSGSGKDCIRYSTCLALTIRSVASSFLFAAGQDYTRIETERCVSNTEPSIFKTCTFEYVWGVKFLWVPLFRYRYLCAHLEKIRARGQVGDAVWHYHQELRYTQDSSALAELGGSWWKRVNADTHVLYLILELCDAIHMR